jgi:hypothetical protein
MKFKNAVFMNEKFMETLTKCNTFEDWPPKDAYWFNRFVKKMGSAQEDWNDVRVKLIKKFGDEDDEGNTKVAEVHVQAFSTALGEIMEEEFEIEGINKIKFPSDLKLSPIEIGLIEEVFDLSAFEEDGEA